MLKAIFKAVPFWGRGEQESLKLQGFPTLLGPRADGQVLMNSTQGKSETEVKTLGSPALSNEGEIIPVLKIK